MRNAVRNLVSAGGVVYRRCGSEAQIVLCGRTEPPTWHLPKGTPDPGEQIEETAVREVREETGLEAEIEASLGSIVYWFARPEENMRYRKKVHFFLMEPKGGTTDLHDSEFDVVAWFPAEDALRTVAYPTEAKVVQRALDVIKKAGTLLER